MKKYLCADCPNFCYTVKVDKNSTYNVKKAEYFLGFDFSYVALNKTDGIMNTHYIREEKCYDTLILWKK